MKLEDGRYIIFLNTTSKEIGLSKELQNLFAYVQEGKLEDTDEFLCDLDKEITKLNREDGVWRRNVYKYERMLAEAENKGKLETSKEIARKMKEN